MIKRKTILVWSLLILFSIYILINLAGLVFTLFNIDKILNETLNPVSTIIQLILSVIALIITIIYVIKLYNISLDVFKWTNIFFGYIALNVIINQILNIFVVRVTSLIFSILPLILGFLLLYFIWLGITKHLKRAKKEELMIFS